MKVKKIEKEVYVTDNGKEFFEQQDAAEYEGLIEKINKMSPVELKNLLTLPTQRQIVQVTAEEQKNINQFKNSIVAIIGRNTRAQASSEAKLGNMIMELQDLIK